VSYARFGQGSGVYVFLSTGGWLECCACALAPQGRVECVERSIGECRAARPTPACQRLTLVDPVEALAEVAL
jgi:hypothetical protein